MESILAIVVFTTYSTVTSSIARSIFVSNHGFQNLIIIISGTFAVSVSELLYCSRDFRLYATCEQSSRFLIQSINGLKVSLWLHR